MNNRPPLAARKPGSIKAVLVLTFAVTVATLWLVVALLRTSPAETQCRHPRRSMPSGQVQADARTLLAAVDYLLQRDDEESLPLAAAAAFPGALAGQPAGFSTPTICCLSNQAELPAGPITNLPARG